MFTARDKLRVETQLVSSDSVSRSSAMEARSTGQFAVFDPEQTSNGIYLACGSHCAVKAGRGLCGCSRAKVAIRRGFFVYQEFSITVSSGKVPMVAVGLSPPDAPLNVMVGSWPRSVGLYSDGQLLIGSHWHQCSQWKLEAGSTVGILVYMHGSVDEGYSRNSMDREEERGVELSMMNHRAIAEHGTGYGADVNTYGTAKEGKEMGMGTLEVSTQQRPVPVSTLLHPVHQVHHHTTDGMTQAAAPGGSSVSTITNSSIDPLSPHYIASPSPLPTPSTRSQQSSMMRFNVNGNLLELTPGASTGIDSVLSTVLQDHTPLHPTVSLFSETSRMWCRFCESDIVYRRRRQIGAPPGVRVYCLDGSLLLEEDEE